MDGFGYAAIRITPVRYITKTRLYLNRSCICKLFPIGQAHPVTSGCCAPLGGSSLFYQGGQFEGRMLAQSPYGFPCFTVRAESRYRQNHRLAKWRRPLTSLRCLAPRCPFRPLVSPGVRPSNIARPFTYYAPRGQSQKMNYVYARVFYLDRFRTINSARRCSFISLSGR